MLVCLRAGFHLNVHSFREKFDVSAWREAARLFNATIVSAEK